MKCIAEKKTKRLGLDHQKYIEPCLSSCTEMHIDLVGYVDSILKIVNISIICIYISYSKAKVSDLKLFLDFIKRINSSAMNQCMKEIKHLE